MTNLATKITSNPPAIDGFEERNPTHPFAVTQYAHDTQNWRAVNDLSSTLKSSLKILKAIHHSHGTATMSASHESQIGLVEDLNEFLHGIANGLNIPQIQSSLINVYNRNPGLLHDVAEDISGIFSSTKNLISKLITILKSKPLPRFKIVEADGVYQTLGDSGMKLETV